LGPQLQRNIIAYVDDIVVMSKNKEDHIADLKETFANLRAAGLKLNPEKCIFRVSKGKMLGYIISAKGIKANLDKTKDRTFNQERGTKAHRQDSSTQQIHLKIDRAQPPILQIPKRQRQRRMGNRAVKSFQTAQKLYGD
jgi:hypothetical protein